MGPVASLTLECTQVCMCLLNAQLQRERRVQPCSDLLGIWRSDADPAVRVEAPLLHERSRFIFVGSSGRRVCGFVLGGQKQARGAWRLSNVGIISHVTQMVIR